MGDASYVDYVTGRWPALFRVAYLLTGAQEPGRGPAPVVLMKAYASWGRIQRMDAPDAYVRRMLVNGAISSAKRGWRREHATGELPESPQAGHEDGFADRAALWPGGLRRFRRGSGRWWSCATTRTSPRRRSPRVLGCSRGTVKSQASDALRSLRRTLATSPGGGDA